MSRGAVTFVWGLALIMSGCERDEPEAAIQERPAREAFPQPLELIPNEADALVGLYPTKLAGSSLAQQLAAELAAEPQFQEAQQALRGCGLELASFEAVVVGSHEDEFALVLVGAGFGEDARAICMIEAAQRFVGAEPDAKISVEDGKKIMDFPDGRAYLVNANLLVLTTAAWQANVGALIDGEGKPAATHGKRDLLATLDTHAAAWLAADLPREFAMLANFMGIPDAAAAQTLSGTLQLGDHAVLELTAGFEDTAQAQTAAAGLDALMLEAAPNASPALASALGRAHVGHANEQVRLGFQIAAGDFAALAAAKHGN